MILVVTSNENNGQFITRTFKYRSATGVEVWNAYYSDTPPIYHDRTPRVATDAAGNVYSVAGRIVKYSSVLGAQLWSINAEGSHLKVDVQGNPIIGSPGLTFQNNGAAILTKRSGANGDLIWSAIFNGDSLTELAIDPSGRIVAAGSTYEYSNTNIRVNLFDGATGSQIWNYDFDGGAGASDYLNAMVVGADSAIYLAGSAQLIGKRSAWMVQKLRNPPAPPPYLLTVAATGTGHGLIKSLPTGINCDGCTVAFPLSAIVTLTAFPDAQSTFLGWSGGGCAGVGNCLVTMSTARNVTARFELKKIRVAVSVSYAASGTGVVSSIPSGINCGNFCVAAFNYGSNITLSATPASGSIFSGWAGGLCSGLSTCSFQSTQQAINDAPVATAVFSAGPVILTVINNGASGGGIITSSPLGIDCGTVCRYAFPQGAVVTLSAAPASESVFSAWNSSAPTCSGTAPCTITMNADITVSASFARKFFNVNVAFAGTGAGRVVSNPPLIVCGNICASQFTIFDPPTFSAIPIGASIFAGWSGAGCSGTGTCSPLSNMDSVVTAIFSAVAPSAPPAPTIGTVINGNTLVAINFSPPNNDNGSAITYYTATCLPGPVIAQGSASPIIVIGLTNSASYGCTVTASNSIGESPASAIVGANPSGGISLDLIGVQSRKIHGGVKAYDLPMYPGARVEPRAVGSGHTIAFQFNGAVSDTGTISVSPVGTVTATKSSNEVIVTLTNVPDNQNVTVTLANVNNSYNPLSVMIGFLIGDVNNSHSVNSSDISAVKARVGRPLGVNNFQFDIDTSGIIDAIDVSAVKARTGMRLP